MEGEKKRRISNGAAAAMILVAVVCDLIALLPVVGGLIGGVGGVVIFGIWFYFLKIPLVNPRTLIRWVLSLIGEGISVGFLPGITAGVILIIVMTRAEDASGISVLDKIPAGAKNVGAVATQARRDVAKELRRAANPERTAQAQARLDRIRRARAAAPEPSTTFERPPLRDLNYPTNA